MRRWGGPASARRPRRSRPAHRDRPRWPAAGQTATAPIPVFFPGWARLAAGSGARPGGPTKHRKAGDALAYAPCGAFGSDRSTMQARRSPRLAGGLGAGASAAARVGRSGLERAPRGRRSARRGSTRAESPRSRSGRRRPQAPDRAPGRPRWRLGESRDGGARRGSRRIASGRPRCAVIATARSRTTKSICRVSEISGPGARRLLDAAAFASEPVPRRRHRLAFQASVGDRSAADSRAGRILRGSPPRTDAGGGARSPIWRCAGRLAKRLAWAPGTAARTPP